MIDINLNNTSIILNNEIDIFIQEIEMQFDTRYTEILGYTEYGSDFENSLWDLNVSNSKIKKDVNNILNRCQLSEYFTWDINVNILNGTKGDIILVSINIYDNNHNKTTKNYKIIR